ncbi:MAG: hypothetical protein LKE40_02760 [Spirochaetia bacterium]|nr:hypothetical protein [Spirochaetia bacterium]
MEDLRYPIHMQTGCQESKEMTCLCSFRPPMQKLAEDFYRLGALFSRKKEIAKSLDCFSDTFLLRNLDVDGAEDDFIEFFRIQFAIYLLGRRSLGIDLCEGDMIFDLIRNEWEDLSQQLAHSAFDFDKSNLRQWYKTIRIDFPWCFEEADSL